MKNNEKQILNLIRYLPVLLVLLISSILTFYLYYQNIERFKKESESLESKYISINKELIQFQIQRIKQNILLAKQNNIKRLKNQLKMQVDNAYSIAYSLYMNNQDKSKLEITKLIKDALRDIRFNQDRGYLFIYLSVKWYKYFTPYKT
jgi:biopolymer transport protein ExbD